MCKLTVRQIYSLVSQRDNEISYATAVASQRIAEASKRDSEVMKQLAEDSKEVALRTYRDSANMKIMTRINLFTLPGTFTAVSLVSDIVFDQYKADQVSDLFQHQLLQLQTQGHL